MATHMLTAEYIRSRLSYDPQSGEFTWLNGPKAGLKAGGALAGKPYLYINICGRPQPIHRLAWLHIFGDLPPAGTQIDHFDTDPKNNRIGNLRAVTPQENAQNQRKAHRDNMSTGMLGVSPNGKNGFMAKIYINKKQVYLGTFRTKEEASAAYTAAKRVHHAGNTL